MTFGKGPVRSPSFSPDGRFTAYFGHESGEDGTANVGVRLISRDRGEIVDLTPGFDRSPGCGMSTDVRFDPGRSGPFWSYDGRWNGDLNELLAWSPSLPETCRVSAKGG